MRALVRITAAGAVLALALSLAGLLAGEPAWSREEKAILRDLRLTRGPLAPDPSNRYAASEDAAELGGQLFFDRRFSSNGTVACATCHVPDRYFQDGLPLSKGVGTTGRRTMPIAGVASSPWFFWDGRKDSLWSQALGPLESPVEHGGDRAQYVLLLATHYRRDYERVFGAFPELFGVPPHASPGGTKEARAAWQRMTPGQQDAVNRVFANIGKAIAAYERRIQPRSARFDHYVDAVVAGDSVGANGILSRDERAGLRLFIGKGDCIRCHNGPLLTNNDFANVGTPVRSGLPADRGRMEGARQVMQDEFNCLSSYSDALPSQCGELRHIHVDARSLRQYKVPSLRNVADHAPYMHAGQLATLEAVVEHYNRAPASPTGESEIKPLGLSVKERKQLVLFLATLSAPLATEPVPGAVSLQ